MNNRTWLDQNRNIIFIALLLLTLAGLASFWLNQPVAEPIGLDSAALPLMATSLPEIGPSPTPRPVRVYVTGAVVKSDVYVLPAGSIIKDAILAAGGVTAEADPERINQALELQDQQQIHVPARDEVNPLPAIQGGAGPVDPVNRLAVEAGPDQGLLNLNTATLEQLDTLPGIGPVIGQRIIDYRESVGGFKTIEEITEVSGIGEATYSKIRPLVTIE
jgi:competence protein ComEA